MKKTRYSPSLCLKKYQIRPVWFWKENENNWVFLKNNSKKLRICVYTSINASEFAFKKIRGIDNHFFIAEIKAAVLAMSMQLIFHLRKLLSSLSGAQVLRVPFFFELQWLKKGFRSVSNIFSPSSHIEVLFIAKVMFLLRHTNIALFRRSYTEWAVFIAI